MNKYRLSPTGEMRCDKNEFFLQGTPQYKGYTEKIFRLLGQNEKPLTIREISELTGIRPRSVNGILMFNIYAGYIQRIPLY